MLEFVVVWLLARSNGGLVERKGHRPLNYQVATFLLWFGGEIVGAILGALVVGTEGDTLLGIYAFALAGAVLGALVSRYLAEAAPTIALPDVSGWPTHMVPATGMVAWPTPDPSTPPIALPPQLPVAVLTRQGDWALVRATNGWQGWVDGRLLVAASRPQPAAMNWTP